jgi:hypothetical protein
MDVTIVREKSVRIASRFGINIPETLPLLECDLAVRPTAEVFARMLAMHAITAISYGFDRDRVIAWLESEELMSALTPQERRFAVNGIGQDTQFQLQVEGIWALAWILGITSNLDFAEYCDNHFVMMLPNLKKAESSENLRRKIKLRSLPAIISCCDLAYCLHWGIRQRELDGMKMPKDLKPYVVVERRRALEWALSSSEWDEVSLDT